MNTEIEVLEAQYRRAFDYRREAKQALDAILPEYHNINDICEHLGEAMSCMKELKLYEDLGVILHMLGKFETQQEKLFKPYLDASQAYKDARHAEAQCKRRLEAAKQIGI